MSHQIIGLHHWFDSPPGRYLLEWEQARLDEAVADIFGYHSLQLGIPMLDGLRANRMPYQWLALGQDAVRGPIAYAQAGDDEGAPLRRRTVDLLAEPVALPFSDASLDLIVLPHTLELSIDPHAALREVERVLVPEGRVVISGLNPASLWGLRQRRARLYQRLGRGNLYLPDVGEFIAYRRLRDWLQLLSFEVESARFGCYRPAVRSAHWLERLSWMDPLGERWWPILGAAYFLVAVKRVYGMRLLEPAWRNNRQRATATVPVANRARGRARTAQSMPVRREQP
ncbi:methyltransferase domain-containing protein [Acidovorax sp.]|uniref:class I SAM-dependent methyltransferase n=1 Tax=Acidovorax sp. TaxID=1872122 RepID=UPI00261BABFB|nr:methyltransferase domain-containing protein [Acidovorax sp.]